MEEKSNHGDKKQKSNKQIKKIKDTNTQKLKKQN